MTNGQHQSTFDLDDTGTVGEVVASRVEASGEATAGSAPSKAAITDRNTGLRETVVREIRASDLRLHPRLGCTVEELRGRYAAAVEAETDCLRREVPPAGLPRVMAIEGTTNLGALTDIPTAIAAIDLVAKGALVTLTVIEVREFSGEAFVKEVLVPNVSKSLWEQASAIEYLRAEYGSLREWMRQNKLDFDKWDPRCSKLVKILGLPEIIRAKIDLFSIKSAKDAGDIVTLWADKSNQDAMMTVLQKETALSNDRVPAGPLFKKMLAGTSGFTSKVAWKEQGERRILVDRAGRTVATMTIDEDGWTLEGDYRVEGDWNLVAAALKLL